MLAGDLCAIHKPPAGLEHVRATDIVSSRTRCAARATVNIYGKPWVLGRPPRVGRSGCRQTRFGRLKPALSCGDEPSFSSSKASNWHLETRIDWVFRPLTRMIVAGAELRSATSRHSPSRPSPNGRRARRCGTADPVLPMSGPHVEECASSHVCIVEIPCSTPLEMSAPAGAVAPDRHAGAGHAVRVDPDALGLRPPNMPHAGGRGRHDCPPGGARHRRLGTRLAVDRLKGRRRWPPGRR